MRSLVLQGPEVVLQTESGLSPSVSRSALARRRAGHALGNQRLSRDEIHARERPPHHIPGVPRKSHPADVGIVAGDQAGQPLETYPQTLGLREASRV